MLIIDFKFITESELPSLHALISRTHVIHKTGGAVLDIMKTFNKVLLGYHYFLEDSSLSYLKKSLEHYNCRDSDKCVKSSKKK